jgi:hypothetical protein
MDTTPKAVRAYSHHGGWNNATIPENQNNPFYMASVSGVMTSFGEGLTHLKYDPTVDMTNYIEFFATAGQVYTIALGGNGAGRWNQNVSDYALTVQAVPVPGAVWLFGSAMAGMVGFSRRRKAAIAA